MAASEANVPVQGCAACGAVRTARAAVCLAAAGVLVACTPTARIHINEAVVGPQDWDGMGSAEAAAARDLFSS